MNPKLEAELEELRREIIKTLEELRDYMEKHRKDGRLKAGSGARDA